MSGGVRFGKALPFFLFQDQNPTKAKSTRQKELSMRQTQALFQLKIGRCDLKQATIYYEDELNDEFSTAVITPRKIDGKYVYCHKGLRKRISHFSKRLFYLPYPHTDNVKQWQVSRVHKIFGYYQFDDILYEYIYLKRKFEEEKKK